MVPNGSAYENFPAFGNNGTKTPPGGSTESAKYALGMVPADTFPAEWANYLFHGATAGITRLNSDTGSIKKEINTVLGNFNITPDATLNNQLLAALNKLKADAALAAHPVGSLYWTSSNENPATTFGGGTWTQIKDKFILAAGDTYSNGGTGGAATVTLTANQIPSHKHTGTTDNGGVQHTHGMNHVHYSSGRTAATGDHSHTTLNSISTTTTSGAGGHSHTVSVREVSHAGSSYGNPSVAYDAATNYALYTVGETNSVGNHTHDFNHYHNTNTTGNHDHLWDAWSGGSKTTDHNNDRTNTDNASAYLHTHGFTTGNTGGGQAHENMPPYIVKFCWERVS